MAGYKTDYIWDKKEVKSLLLDVEQISYSLFFAQGQSAGNGYDGEWMLVYTKALDKHEQPFNFRNIIDHVPSVTSMIINLEKSEVHIV